MIKKYLIFLTLIFSVYSCAVITEKAAQKAAQKTKEYTHPAINELKRVGIHAKEIYQKGKDYFL